ncbi:hypothetical protein, partial [Pseudomonas indica]|uniref:hypothetical protein n=1 Tax=Pseudomonas indica TaxID=137658 RepID=UPI001C3EA206
RFIPAPAGNTADDVPGYGQSAVHPRTRGEHTCRNQLFSKNNSDLEFSTEGIVQKTTSLLPGKPPRKIPPFGTSTTACQTTGLCNPACLPILSPVTANSVTGFDSPQVLDTLRCRAAIALALRLSCAWVNQNSEYR